MLLHLLRVAVLTWEQQHGGGGGGASNGQAPGARSGGAVQKAAGGCLPHVRSVARLGSNCIVPTRFPAAVLGGPCTRVAASCQPAAVGSPLYTGPVHRARFATCRGWPGRRAHLLLPSCQGLSRDHRVHAQGGPVAAHVGRRQGPRQGGGETGACGKRQPGGCGSSLVFVLPSQECSCAGPDPRHYVHQTIHPPWLTVPTLLQTLGTRYYGIAWGCRNTKCGSEACPHFTPAVTLCPGECRVWTGHGGAGGRL